MRKQYLTPLLLTVLMGQFSTAATVKDFNQVWSAIKSEHPELKSATEEQLAAEASSSRAARHWLPTVQLFGRGYSTNDPLMHLMGNLGQRSVTALDFSPSTLNQPGPAMFAQFGVGAMLPLYEGGASVAVSQMSDLETQGKAEMRSAKELEVYSQTVSAYAGILNSEEATDAMQDLKQQVSHVLSRYSVGSRSNPVGYSGLLGLKSILNRIQANLNQFKVEKQSQVIAIENRGGSFEKDWTVKKEKIGSFLSSVLSDSMVKSADHSHYLNSAQARTDAMDSKVSMQRARFLPQLGVFADGNYYLGDRSNSTAYAGGLYLRWSIFNPRDFGAVGEEKHLKTAAEESLRNARINEKLARADSIDALASIVENEKILTDSTQLMNEQVVTASRLFQSGSINALQLVEVFNRRADLILQMKELNQRHIDVRTGLAKISNGKGIQQ